MKFISVRNSNKSTKELLFGMRAFIHRKNKGEKVRFNPSFKEYIGNRGIGFTMTNVEGSSKVAIAVSKEYGWKLSKGSNMKASNLTTLLDEVYDKKTNRYSLVYHDTNEHGDIFFVEPQDEVEEKEVSDEMREAARERFSEFWKSKKEEEREGTTNSSPEIVIE